MRNNRPARAGGSAPTPTSCVDIREQTASSDEDDGDDDDGSQAAG